MHLPNQLRTHLLALTVAGLGGMTAEAVVPYTQATVTRLQNKVSFGESAQKARRAAQPGDAVKAETYLLTESDSVRR